MSLLNSIYYHTIEDLLLNSLDVDFHPTLMAGAGDQAAAAAEQTFRSPPYVLVVEGAIPAGNRGQYCMLWPGMTALRGILRFARRASFVIGAGTCAAYGGVVAGAPNPTRARGLGTRIAKNDVINIPGCPVHPDWVVGTIAYLMAHGQPPELDGYGRPKEFFGEKIHGPQCPMKRLEKVKTLGKIGCLKELGCKGPKTKADCHLRQWNSGGRDEYGINWCIGAGAPCFGCTEPTFPDGMSPFYKLKDADEDDKDDDD